MKNLKSHYKTLKSGKKVYLRTLIPEDVSQGYVDWLNDPETSRYLESRYDVHTPDSCAAFVKKMLDSEHDAMFGIFMGDTHVGNIKIGNTHPLYRHADIGLLIGKPYWGYGIGTAAIWLAEEIAFNDLKLHKLYAGAYKENTGSISTFIRNGWKVAGEMKEHYISDGRFTDSILIEKINNELLIQAAQLSDMQALFELANDPSVRANSFNQAAIAWEEHEKWFSGKLADKNCFFFVARDRDGYVVGQNRLDADGREGVLSISIASASRSLGYGTSMFKHIISQWEQGKIPTDFIKAKVKKENKASEKAFIKAGFTISNQPDINEFWYPHQPKEEQNA